MFSKVLTFFLDRILVAGGEQHIAAKSTPFEMQVENAVLPPTKDQVSTYLHVKSTQIKNNNWI